MLDVAVMVSEFCVEGQNDLLAVDFLAGVDVRDDEPYTWWRSDRPTVLARYQYCSR